MSLKTNVICVTINMHYHLQSENLILAVTNIFTILCHLKHCIVTNPDPGWIFFTTLSLIFTKFFQVLHVVQLNVTYDNHGRKQKFSLLAWIRLNICWQNNSEIWAKADLQYMVFCILSHFTAINSVDLCFSRAPGWIAFAFFQIAMYFA